jgi:hypothetical protein
MFAGVTVDVAKLTDLYEAIALVDGAVVVYTATDKYGRRSRPAARAQLGNNAPSPVAVVEKRIADPKPAAPRVAVVSRSAARKHATAKADPRAVFAKSNLNPSKAVIDVPATLRKMGLTIEQLDAMRTKRGTLEYTVKRSLGLNRRYKRNRTAEVAL